MTERKALNVCDWCTGGTVRWVYLTPGFKIVWDPPALADDTIFDTGGWGACRPCSKMIESDDLEGLIRRAIRVVRLRGATEDADLLDRHFRPLFAKLLEVKSARKTPEETKDIQGYDDEPMGIAWQGDKVGFIQPNKPLDEEMGLGRG